MGGKQFGIFVVVGIVGTVLGGALVGLSTNLKGDAALVRADTPAVVDAVKSSGSPRVELQNKPHVGRNAPFEVRGKTQALPSFSAQIAPTVLHPVVRVLAVPGQQVEKGQPLVELDR